MALRGAQSRSVTALSPRFKLSVGMAAFAGPPRWKLLGLLALPPLGLAGDCFEARTEAELATCAACCTEPRGTAHFDACWGGLAASNVAACCLVPPPLHAEAVHAGVLGAWSAEGVLYVTESACARSYY